MRSMAESSSDARRVGPSANRGPESLRSPNAIPPRRSSFIQKRMSSLPQEQPTVKPALGSLPESSWMSQGPKARYSMDPTNLPPSALSPLTFGDRADIAILANDSTWSQEKEKMVLGPYDYLKDHPGKDIRRQMIAAFNAWLQVPKQNLAIITKVIGMLHTSSLLIDDVEDSSLLRRGIPVAHSIFGVPQTINSANYVYFTALKELLKLGNPRAIEIYTHELCNLHRGQGMDLFWRDTLTCPTEDDYLEMVGNKTGGLFRLAVQLMQAESTSEKNYLPLVNTIGLIFQIRDDYMNLSSSEYTSNKGICEDLTEGKFSFPVIHSIRANPSNRQLLNILKQKTDDVEVKKYAVKYMEGTGSFEYCRQVLKELKVRALGMIEDLDKGADIGAGVRTILDKMDI